MPTSREQLIASLLVYDTLTSPPSQVEGSRPPPPNLSRLARVLYLKIGQTPTLAFLSLTLRGNPNNACPCLLDGPLDEGRLSVEAVFFFRHTYVRQPEHLLDWEGIGVFGFGVQRKHTKMHMKGFPMAL